MRASRESGGSVLLQCSQVGLEFQHGGSLNPEWLTNQFAVAKSSAKRKAYPLLRRRWGKGCARKRPERHGPRNDSLRRFISALSLGHLLSVGQLLCCKHFVRSIFRSAHFE